jgi:formylglycine-generating enzyme required for sulfatase activity
MNTTVRRMSIVLVLSIMCCATSLASAVTIATVPVGNAGNANDPATGNRFGGVSYNYRIGTTEVTVGQYTAFLNAVGATDTYKLYNTSMATDLNSAGIARSGDSGSYTYNVIGSPNKPVTYVNFGDAARFANWLHNGQPVGLQDAGTTEGGAYTLNGATSNSAYAVVTRNSGATWCLPSESEWYKAAYYDSAGGTYYQYPTSSNTAPTSAPPGGTPNTANFFSLETGYAVTGTSLYDSSQNYLTDVGGYTASASPYGTYDQGGNVWEWNEAMQFGSRGVRGGSWVNIGTSFMASSFGAISQPDTEGYVHGFRVVVVPEPATLSLAAIGVFVLLACRNRRRVIFALKVIPAADLAASARAAPTK